MVHTTHMCPLGPLGGLFHPAKPNEVYATKYQTHEIADQGEEGRVAGERGGRNGWELERCEYGAV